MNCTQSLDSGPNPTEDGWSRHIFQSFQVTDCHPGETKFNSKTQLQCSVNSGLFSASSRVPLMKLMYNGWQNSPSITKHKHSVPINHALTYMNLPTFLQHISLRYILILSFHLCLVSQVVTSLHTFLPNCYVYSSLSLSLSLSLWYAIIVLISPSLIWTSW